MKTVVGGRNEQLLGSLGGSLGACNADTFGQFIKLMTKIGYI